MGLLHEGKWHDFWYETAKNKGHFVRKQAQFRNWVTADGKAGPTGEGGFKAESGRYHLYVAYACPWAHRTLIFRALKGLEDHISVSVVNWLALEKGWTFEPCDGIVSDEVNHSKFMYEVYLAADDNYSGRVTVPVLWDKHKNTIVSNESSEIIRMMNSAFDDVGAVPGDLYPPEKRGEIDQLNDRIYETLNNGVYRSGFSTTQEAYEEAVIPLFETLDFLDERLATRRYLTGNTITEADWRLFTTLIRFDPVYVGHFKCNLRRIVDYPNLSGYVRDLYQQPGIAGTTNMDHIKKHYYASHLSVNPTGIVPMGPDVDFSTPHGRENIG